MEPQKQIVIFLAEFDFQVKQIDSIYGSLENKVVSIEKKRVAAEAVESTGYWMHNLYCAFEDLFKLVAGFWENNLSANGDYHIHLLKRMLVEIEHAYSYGLDNERVSALLRKILDQKNTVISDLQTFRNTVAGFTE